MDVAAQVLDRNPRAASRLLSWIEDGDPRAAAEMKTLYRRAKAAYVVGVTGPPGAGKSTLVDRLVALRRGRGAVVGVLAVDPSSPFSGGAVLGDRVRMQRHAADPGVFIRSMANRGRTGGLSRGAAEAVRVLEAWGCEIVFVETVGVGQSEIEVSRLACTTILVCAPGAGDRIQAIKAGVTEIDDIVVLNKGDRPEAAHAASALEMMLSLCPGEDWTVPLVQTVALEGRGLEALDAALDAHRRFAEGRGIAAAKRRAQFKERLLELVRERLMRRVAARVPDEEALDALAARMLAGETDPYTLAERIAGEDAAR